MPQYVAMRCPGCAIVIPAGRRHCPHCGSVGRYPVAERAPSLSPRDLAIVRLLATGLTYRGAAHALDRSPSTIKAHMTSVFHRYDVRCLTELLAVLGWLVVPEDEPVRRVS